MKKREFLDELGARLARLPTRDVAERLNFYEEMIDDRVEEGCSEEDAVSKIGTPEEIAAKIIAETPLLRIAGERIRPKRRIKVWEILLLVLGFPLWAPLLIAAVAVLLSLYVTAWSVIVSLWSVFAAFVGTAFGAFVLCAVSLFGGAFWRGGALFGVALFSSGASVLAFLGCREATKGWIRLTGLLILCVKKGFAKTEASK